MVDEENEDLHLRLNREDDQDQMEELEENNEEIDNNYRPKRRSLT